MSEMPEFSGFPRAGLQFLDDLARNNNRDLNLPGRQSTAGGPTIRLLRKYWGTQTNFEIGPVPQSKSRTPPKRNRPDDFLAQPPG